LMRAVDPSLTNGVVVNRIARTADPAGTQDQTGNGRVNIARALADTSTDAIQPAGAAPVGGGGPFVGPYKAAACNNNSPNISRSTIQANGDPGFISQGNSYFVYAQIDAMGGGCTITSANADLNSVTTGATSVVFATTGGPWM